MKLRLLRSSRRGISVYFFLLFVFIILKIIRNTTNYSSEINGGIWNIIVALFVVIGFLYFLNNRYAGKYEPIQIGLLLAYFTFVNALIQLQTISVSSIYYLLVSSFYVFVMILFFNKPLKNDNTRQNLEIGVFMLIIQLFLLVIFVRYFSIYKYYQSKNYLSLDSAYYSICLFPFVLKYRSKLTIPNTVLLYANAIISSKRAGLIAIVMAILIYYWLVAQKRGKITKKIWTFLIGLIILALFFFAFQYVDNKLNMGLAKRLFGLIYDGGSGRITIYLSVWREFSSSRIWEQLVGHGLTSIISMNSIKISSAHNDLLNILYESGIVPAILYVLFIISIVKQGIKMFRTNYGYAAVYISTIPICLVLTLFTSFFCSVSCSIIIAAYWGMEMRDYDTFLGGVRNVN